MEKYNKTYKCKCSYGAYILKHNKALLLWEKVKV